MSKVKKEIKAKITPVSSSLLESEIAEKQEHLVT